MEDKIVEYRKRFNDCVALMRETGGAVEASTIALVAAELVQDMLFFTNLLKDARLDLATVARDYIVSEVDGKPMSAAKAEILTNASEEADAYEVAKMHVANFDQMISILKIYIRSLAKEYSLQGPM